MNTAASASTLRFRFAEPHDVAGVRMLVESAYRGDASRAGWTTEADLLDGQRTDVEGIVELIERGGSRMLLAEHAGVLLACCQIEKQDDACYFGMFSVSPTAQGAGIGKQVLAESERIARDAWNCREMQMTVISVRDDLIAWYERRGYRRSGIYKPFPYGDERYGIPKRLDLRFEVLVKDLR
ncbi:MAG: GNAT family N-acetyltransferase [Rhodanobacteraceae bacterium]